MHYLIPEDNQMDKLGILDKLLNLQGEKFIHEAYRTVLKREPDQGGLSYYLKRLRQGVSKLEILAQLRYSKEGKRIHIGIPDFDKALRKYRRSKISLSGLWQSIFVPWRRLSKFNLLENQLHTLREIQLKQSRQLNQLITQLGKLQDKNQIVTKKKVATPEQTVPSAPLISIVTPCYKTSIYHLERLAMSLWMVKDSIEWVIVNDSPKSLYIEVFVNRMKQSFPNLHYVPHKNNEGIFVAYSSGMMAACAPYVAILDHDDEVDLIPMLAMIEKAAEDYDIIYSDEVKFGQKQNEYFVKPTFDPLSAMHYFYMHHITCFRTELCKAIILEDKTASIKYKSCFDIWLAFNYVHHFQKKEIKAAHIPYSAYGWRVHDESTAKNLDQKPMADFERVQIAKHLYTSLDPLALVTFDSDVRYSVRYNYCLSTPKDRQQFFEHLDALFVVGKSSSILTKDNFSKPENYFIEEVFGSVPLVYLANFLKGSCAIFRRDEILGEDEELFFDFVKWHIPKVPILKPVVGECTIKVEDLVKKSIGLVIPKHLLSEKNTHPITHFLIV